MLLVEVLANGRVGEVEVEDSSGYELLDDAAVRAVRRWRFVPAETAGIPVTAQVKIPVEFNLEGKK
jgi:protein TonB